MSERQKVEWYKNKIRELVNKTDDVHTLCSTYTVIKTHLDILAEKGGAV